MRQRRLPTRDECVAGIPLVLENADGHVAAADALAASGHVGFATAHLILALEESEKARTLGKVAMGEPVSQAELRAAMYEYRPRHVGALGKSWTSGAIPLIMEAQKERIWEKLGRAPAKTDEERWTELLARHPEVLPPDWAENAGALRERSFYVDLDERGWTTPSDRPRADFDRLRPAVGRQLLHLRAAYEREIVLPHGEPA